MEKPRPLKPQEARCLLVVRALLDSEVDPTFKMVAAEMGISRSGAQKYMNTLRREGYLRGPRVKVVGEWALTVRGTKELEKKIPTA